ncbi:helix-turn-helix domain-containing protein [Micromonospora humi]|uniref:Transcriptional regulator, contains XRE-family HTH domain n=1 Tax=Micromonospora humi TaxID=745366 RepID=A0A1C5J0X8_9ACTN|nr:helix-turn-helix domain-containing protein [Micromonospora humi]SCG64123.1 Transcriptional regulator, contains XRE-family HTH domain [Micromonospora humi]
MGSVELLPVGRRVAYWRVRRKLSQQVFADQLGKSKSWVDKVERGVRRLDKLSTLQEIARVLRVDTAALVGRDASSVQATGPVEGVDRIRAALSRYEIPWGEPAGGPVVTVDRMLRDVGYAWTTFQYARYPQVVDLVPELLTNAQRTHAEAPRVEAYRIVASLSLKLGDAGLAWLAVDRAMLAAADDRELVSAAAVQLGQVLRALGRVREARSVLLGAAYRITPPVIDDAAPAALSLCGALLIQAALAAAQDGKEAAAGELIDEAAGMAEQVGDGCDHHRTGFGPTAVDLARAAAAVEVGDARAAIAWHDKAIARPGWRWLPAEHRAAHLLDVARAHLHAGDASNAARMLSEVERTAPAEITSRPVARRILAEVVRDPRAPTTIAKLAATLGVG